ncbi:MAG: hypothetical protein QOE17_1507, partial [Gaiellales bacterium]|nr:hypothetical protein [Gaiellales bacterium]
SSWNQPSNSGRGGRNPERAAGRSAQFAPAALFVSRFVLRRRRVHSAFMSPDETIEVGEPAADGGVPILLAGDIDQARADQLREALESAVGETATVVRIDARNLRLLDSPSLGLLLFFARKLQERGGYLELRYAAATVRRTLDVASLGRSMRLVEETCEDTAELR